MTNLKKRLSKKLARRLRIIGIRTVTAVKEGANPGGKVLSVKSKKGGLPMEGVLKVLKQGIARIGEEGQKLLEDALEGVPDTARAQVMAALAMLLRDQSASPAEPEPAAEPETAPPMDALKPELVANQAPEEPPKEEEEDMGLKEELAKSQAETEEVRKELEAFKVAKAKEEILEVVKSFEKVPGELNEHAELLQVVKSKCGDATYSKLVDTLVKAHGLIDAGGGERGSFTADSQDGDGDGGEFVKVVKSLTGKDGITEEQAVTMAATSHPKLYNEWAEAKRSGK